MLGASKATVEVTATGLGSENIVGMMRAWAPMARDSTNTDFIFVRYSNAFVSEEVVVR